MNSSSHSFPVSIGDKVTDVFTGISGTVNSLQVYSDGTTCAWVEYVVNGELKTLWAQCGRLASSQS